MSLWHHNDQTPVPMDLVQFAGVGGPQYPAVRFINISNAVGALSGSAGILYPVTALTALVGADRAKIINPPHCRPVDVTKMQLAMDALP